MKKTCLLAALLAVAAAAQSRLPETPPATADYEELPDPSPAADPAAWARMDDPALARGSTDVRYAKHAVPDLSPVPARQRVGAWRGERVHAQAVLWTPRDLDSVRLSVGPLRRGAEAIHPGAVRASFVRYVMTDGPNADGTGCGHRPDKARWDSSLVADVIDIARTRRVGARSVQPIWVTVSVPADARPGRYEGTLTVEAAGMPPMRLGFEVEVGRRTLTPPAGWKLHLDMWQNPYAVARYHGVPLWSEAHFDAMRPYMRMLADAGQRAVTATLIYEP